MKQRERDRSEYGTLRFYGVLAFFLPLVGCRCNGTLMIVHPLSSGHFCGNVLLLAYTILRVGSFCATACPRTNREHGRHPFALVSSLCGARLRG